MRLTDEILADLLIEDKPSSDFEPPTRLWTKQREIVRLIDTVPKLAVASAHGVGKTHAAANVVCRFLQQNWDDGLVVSTAPTAHQVKNLLWQEIQRAFPLYGSRGRLNQVSWYDGDTLKAIGVTANDTRPETLQGYHAPKILYVIDEASAISAALWSGIMTTLTSSNARVLAIGNPDDPTSQFAKCWDDPSWTTVNISAFDTPLFTGEAITERAANSLVSPRWVLDRKAEWGVGSNLWVAKVLGQFPDSKVEGIIPSSWWDRAQTATSQVRQLGVDLAGEGDDNTVIASNIDGHPQVIYSANTSGQGEDAFDEVASFAAAYIRQHNIKTVQYDGIGIGYAFGTVLRKHLNGWPVALKPFIASEKADDAERFANRRAEAYWMLREKLHKGMIDASDVEQDVRDQFTSTNYFVRKGKIQLEAKDDIRKRIGQSPDQADAIVMACYRTQASTSWEPTSRRTTGVRR